MAEIPKSDNSQAMQSLFTAYGDDDDFDLDDSTAQQRHVSFSDEDEPGDRRVVTPIGSNNSPTTIPVKQGSKRDEENSRESDVQTPAKVPKLERKVTATRLVSYGPDDQEDGEGEDDEEEEQRPSDDELLFQTFNENSGVVTYNGTPMTPEELNTSLSKSLRHSFSEDDVQIPPEPAGNCSIRLQTKISKLYEKVQRTGMDMNAIIQNRKDFRNPSIYDKLIDFCSIDEKGTNYPPELYNPTIWGEDSTYEVLSQIQRAEMDKREKEKRDKKEKELKVVKLNLV